MTADCLCADSPDDHDPQCKRPACGCTRYRPPRPDPAEARIRDAEAQQERLAEGFRWVIGTATLRLDLDPREVAELNGIIAEMLVRLDRTTCDMCGQVHPGCLAHQGHSPIPCKITPLPGNDYCRVHSGSVPDGLG